MDICPEPILRERGRKTARKRATKRGWFVARGVIYAEGSDRRERIAAPAQTKENPIIKVLNIEDRKSRKSNKEMKTKKKK